MTDPVPSKERDTTQGALGELYGWLIDSANQSSPYDSQMLMKAASIVGDRLATPSDEIEQLRQDCRRWENAHKIWLAESERLRKQVNELSIHAEKWVKRATTPAHEREPPHCSSCSCGMTPEPDALRQYVHEQLGHLAGDDNRPAEALIRLAAERATQPPGDGQ